MIIDFLKFLLFFIFSYFIPGYVIVGRTKNSSIAIKIFLAIALGFSLSAISGYLGQWLYYGLIAVSLIIFVATRRYKDFIGKFNFKIDKIGVVVTLLIVSGILFQNMITFRTGLNYSYGVGYWGALAHDGVWHHALINQLMKGLPPQNPGFSGSQLFNYHYFYDLVVAQSAKITGIAVPDLIYRFYPFIFSLLMGIGTYLLSLKLFKSRWAGVASVYLIYFGSSFGWVIDWIKGRELAGESAFWANQPVSFNINPPFAISLILLIAFLIGFKSFSEKKENWMGLALILIGGSLIEFKVYGGLILLASFLLIALKKAVFDREFNYLTIFIFLLAVSLFVFLPGSRGAGGFVTFFPYWIIDSMVDIVDRVGWPRLSLARTVGLETHNWPKFFAAEAAGLFLFIAGNLGTRILALGSFFIIPVKIWWKDNSYLLIFVMLFASLLPTLLFVQKTDPWNIIQFTYYFIYLVAVLAGMALYRIVIKTPKIIAMVIVIAFIVLTPISSVWTFKSGLNENVSYIVNDEIAALNFLRGQPDGVVLTFPYDPYLRYAIKNPTPLPIWAYQTSAYVSAYSNKQTYLEDLMQQGILGNDFLERQKLSDGYLHQRMTSAQAADFLKSKNISYIYIPKALIPQVNVKPQGKIIFENDGAIVYRINNE